MEDFRYHLERNLQTLHRALTRNAYHHGSYRTFTVSDNKRRSIAVASLRDRFVHRLLHEYLEKIYDSVFIYDAWSCRKGKGLHGAVDRAQQFLSRHPGGFFWRGDVEKFFDNVDQQVLGDLLKRRVTDTTAFVLLREIIGSYDAASKARIAEGAERERERE